MSEAKKIFISADIEGTAGITHWDETSKNHPDYPYYAKQMTQEVNAACLGALDAGADEILVKDAHDSARNIDPSALPVQARVLRGWTRNPFLMMAGLDSSFSGVMFTGYHSAAGTNTNPLSHTMNTKNNHVLINGEKASELLFNCLTAAWYGVPVYFVAGDAALCKWVQGVNPNIRTVATLEGVGNASVSIHPQLSVQRIREEVKAALAQDPQQMQFPLPEYFEVQINFKEHFSAYAGGFYPGATQLDERTVAFEASDWLDVLKFLFFVL